MTQYGNITIPLSSDLVEKMKQLQMECEKEKWEDQRKEEVDLLLDIINNTLKGLNQEISPFSISTKTEQAISILSKVKEEVETKKDSFTEKEFNTLTGFIAAFCESTRIS